MKAMVMRAFGPPDVLQMEEVATPIPGAGEVVAAVKAVSVNRTLDLTAEVRRITDGRGADVVFENIGDSGLFPQALKAMARDGRLVTAGSHGGGVVPLDVGFLYLNNLRVIGSTFQRTSDIEPSLLATRAGKLRVKIDRVMPLAEAAAAHHLVAGRGGIGKVVLTP